MERDWKMKKKFFEYQKKGQIKTENLENIICFKKKKKKKKKWVYYDLYFFFKKKTTFKEYIFSPFCRSIYS